MNCFRWIWNENGTAPFLKPKEYQKINVEAYELEEDENDWSTEDGDSKELRDFTEDSNMENSEENKDSTEKDIEDSDNSAEESEED